MIRLRQTIESELPQIVQLERQPDIREYVTPHSIEEHRTDFVDDEVTYLTIENEGEFGGFIILVHPSNNDSIECLRLVVAVRGKGFGQKALQLLEDYGKTEFNAKRIWLDVFAFNTRGIHVYTKLGYQQFGTGRYEGKALLYMEKYLEE